MPKIRKPSRYKEEYAEVILDRISRGESLLEIIRSTETEKFPTRAVITSWAQGKNGAPQDFAIRLARAREIQCDYYAEQIVLIADGLDDDAERMGNIAAAIEAVESGNIKKARFKFMKAKRESIEQSRLRVDSRKWTCARMNRKKWGDRVDLANAPGETLDIRTEIDYSKLSKAQLRKIIELEKELKE